MNGKEKTAKDLPSILWLRGYFQHDKEVSIDGLVDEIESFARQEVEKERAAIIAILDSKRFYLGGGEGELADAIRERNNE